MNGKASRMLRQMRRSDHASKRHFKLLTHIQRGVVRTAHENNVKLIYIDFLHKLFPTEAKKPARSTKHWSDKEIPYTIEKMEDSNNAQYGETLVEDISKAIIADVEATKNAA